MNIAKITLPSDRNAAGIQDVTNLIKKIETNLNLQAQQIQALQPAVRVITQNSVWLPTDRLIVIDTTAGNVTYTLPPPITMINTPFERLVVLWFSSVNVAKVVASDGTFFNGFANVQFTAQYHSVEMWPSVVPGYLNYIYTGTP